jgi:hypothetical protein
MEDCSPSAAEMDSSLLYFRNADGVILLALMADLKRKEGELVLMARDWEMKEVDADEAARAAARRTKCLAGC